MAGAAVRSRQKKKQRLSTGQKVALALAVLIVLGGAAALGYPAFVTNIDAARNQVTLGTHDELYTTNVRIANNKFHGDSSQPVFAQIRYRSQPSEAVYKDGVLTFKEPVWAVTPGQSVVIYQDDLLVGGGLIE